MSAEVVPSALISVIIPVRNGAQVLGRCLEAVFASSYPRYECIVVDDGSTDDSREIAARFPVKLLALADGPCGPAYGRNAGAEAAKWDILLFVDADVAIHPDVLARVAGRLATHPEIDALFGSYDDSPEDSSFVSQYKNLSHHFVHQQGSAEGFTFWSGCGAIRRQVFLEVGGFDYRMYARPSIEDIELGGRLRAAGHRILLDPEIQGKHLKRWSLLGMVISDFFDRGIPWTLLLLRNRNLPNDLNLRISQRMSALLVYLALALLGLATLSHNVATMPLLAGLSLLVIGHWHWPGGKPPFKTSLRAEVATCFLLAGVIGLAVYSGNTLALYPLAPIPLALLAARCLPSARWLWSRTFFAILVAGLAAACALVLLSLPTWLAASLTLVLVAILMANQQYYSFFVRKRGLAFALGAVPYHLLYFFYSVLALALGTAIHLWTSHRRASPSSCPGASLGMTGHISTSVDG